MDHQFNESNYCINCGNTRQDIEDGFIDGCCYSTLDDEFDDDIEEEMDEE